MIFIIMCLSLPLTPEISKNKFKKYKSSLKNKQLFGYMGMGRGREKERELTQRNEPASSEVHRGEKNLST